MEAVGLFDDARHNLRLNQTTFFHCVEDDNACMLKVILNNRKVDMNAYNDEGVITLHLAVDKYQKNRSLVIIKMLLENGSNVSIKVVIPPSTHKISIVRKDKKSPHGEILLETRRITLGQKIALLQALVLKSSLYLEGWEYRHWDDMLKLLVGTTIDHYHEKKEFASPRPLDVVQKN
ncbi:unnamed protein product [Sphagnum balticum]